MIIAKSLWPCKSPSPKCEHAHCFVLYTEAHTCYYSRYFYHRQLIEICFHFFNTLLLIHWFPSIGSITIHLQWKYCLLNVYMHVGRFREHALTVASREIYYKDEYWNAIHCNLTEHTCRELYSNRPIHPVPISIRISLGLLSLQPLQFSCKSHILVYLCLICGIWLATEIYHSVRQSIERTYNL